ncbi:NAD(P)-binding protein [Patellaria atrata CBS 101060]|uniref:NAD(P)-binding protein n=1 Tax=Patellaria atrata CBS 101060 TaxID=1346257 RepID=A0A9P4VS60_9PEZI|nr:NAD(P)-binding protein [Patellaria atrata CBS 101060]
MTSELRITPGSWILVTGANGLVASHIVNEVLKAGYKVRGSVRDRKRSAWLKDKFDELYGPGKFDLVVIKDLTDAVAYGEAVKGVSGIIHTAHTPGINPHVVIPAVIAGLINPLKAAAKEPSVKAVVYTSSSWAASIPIPDVEMTLDSNTYAEDAAEKAWAPPPYETDRAVFVYATSKVEAEKAAFRWVTENNATFAFNTVLPSANFGEVLFPEEQGYPTTVGRLKDLFLGNEFQYTSTSTHRSTEYYIAVQDQALIHLAALINPTVSGERLFAFAEPYNWNEILAIFRKLYPEKKFIDDFPELGHDISKVANERAEELLKSIAGRGFIPLEESVKATVAKVA